MEFFIISMLNGVSYGLLLFMLSSGLTLIFSMMGVLNFAHASFYMVGAYVGYTLSGLICALAGWALIGRIGSVSPTAGQFANIESITAVVIGGISLFGGRG